MPLISIFNGTLSELGLVLGQLSAEEYSQPQAVLSDASIGQHSRHVIEMIQCLLAGYADAQFSYDDRKRDVKIESDPKWALSCLNELMLKSNLPNKEMRMDNLLFEEVVTVNTNYYRELLYNMDHAIHHCAIIRIGLMSFDHVSIPEGFGIAPSTIRHRSLSSCAS
jgi:hypothetical protein